MKRLLYLISCLCLMITISTAQEKIVLEEVIAVVGDFPTFTSEFEAEYFQAKSQYEGFQGDLRCEMFSKLLTDKLLLQKAKIDSIEVAAERVEGEIERRMRFYSSQIGGDEALEKYLGKSLLAYKEEIRDRIKQQLTIEEVRQKILADVKVTPTDVKRFFDEIPADSLPLFDAEVEVGLILLKPEASSYAKEYAYNTIAKLREEIVAGKRDFGIAAASYSDDLGSRIKNGELGYFSRGQMVPSFERAAYMLRGDTVSPIIETEYGYHIMQLVDRKGEKINVRHILIKPKVVSSDLDQARKKLEKAIAEVKSGKLDFCKAAQDLSDDEYTKQNCGFYMDPATGVNKIEVTQLEPDIALLVKNLKPGQFSEILPVAMPDGSTYFRVLYLKSETPPHRANLRDDYQKIQAFALERKKQQTLEEWAEKYARTTYVRVDEKFNQCEELQSWINQ